MERRLCGLRDGGEVRRAFEASREHTFDAGVAADVQPLLRQADAAHQRLEARIGTPRVEERIAVEIRQVGVRHLVRLEQDLEASTHGVGPYDSSR